ncbi:MAG: FtsQ-type POTRA domain-containing protein [Deltaproteobacteria bacterium]|nr:FtsQ-type POTRA domain-containing protein [Deltaproteobacteria bacterium]
MRDYKDYKPRRNATKKSSGKRLAARVFKAAVILLTILALAVAAGYSYRGLQTTSYFNLKEIAVTGEKRVKREEILSLSGVRIGGNILSMDLKRLAEGIESQPWIETANIRRVLPRGLSIEVKEREPFAILKSDILFYLDRGGKPFKSLDEGDAAGYPLITGLSKVEIERDELSRDALMKTFEFIETEAGRWPQDLAISEIIVSRSQGITVLSDNVAVKIGFGEYKIKTERLKRVMDDLTAKGKIAEYIDLTYTGQVVVR